MSHLSLDQQTRVIAALTEGCSIRSTERLTGVNRETVLTLSVRVGEGCRRLHDGMMRGLQVGLIELDEQWQYVACKAKNVREGQDAERGDFYLFVALGATNKAVLSYVVGKRNGENTLALARDLHARLVNRPQITADGWAPYTNAIPDTFNREVDFAQLVKVYQATPGNEAAVRYSPGSIRGTEKTPVCGHPDESKISTSYVERFNLSTRMSLRRFARLSNAFSKKLENHRAAVSLQVAFYNLVRFHETLRCTPAMALGVTDHPWTVSELVSAALSAPEPPPLVTSPQGSLDFGMSAAKAKGEKGGGKPRLFVLKGGRAK